MAKKRVYEVAKDIGLGTRELVRILEILGTEVKSHMSTLEPDAIQKVTDYIEQHKSQAKAAQTQVPQPAAPASRPAPGASAGASGPIAPRRKEETAAESPRPKPGFNQGMPPRPVERPAGAGAPRQGQPSRGPGMQQERSGGYRSQRPGGQYNRGPYSGNRNQGGDSSHGGGGPMQGRGPTPSARPGGQPQAREGRPQSRPVPGGPGRPAPGGMGRPTSSGGRPTPGRGGAPGGTSPRPAPGGGRPANTGRPAPTGRPGGQGRPGTGRPSQGPPGGSLRDKARRQIPSTGGPGGRSYLNAQDEDERRFGGRRKHKSGRAKEVAKVVSQPAKKITLEGAGITVQELASKMGRSAAEIIKKLISLGVMAGINEELDQDTVSLLAAEFGVDVRIKVEKSATEVEEVADDPERMENRPPVVTVMGHVDHGKTSLLDAFRHTNVTAREAGGITQHIGAYQVELDGRKITFVDTPGHAAFTSMRARGAQVTDIAVLVVAAEDGVMPQTVEAINHAKAAGVPIVVAMNKMDRPDANPDRLKQQLMEHNLVPEEWGGDVICVPVSAVKRTGLEELLEMILLVAEMQNLKADPTKPAMGVVLETELDRGRGPMATVLVRGGTLRVGDNFVVGDTCGRVRGMLDEQGRSVKEAPPSMPVRVLGLDQVPEAGDVLQVVSDEKMARDIASARSAEKRRGFAPERSTSLEDMLRQMETQGSKDLNVIAKADVHGSVEAVRQALERLGNDEVRIKVIHGGVGAITESDIMLAATSHAMIVGFNVRPDAGARKAAEEQRVEVRLYRIIYELMEDMKATLSGMLEPESREVELGRAEVRATFHVPKVGTVAGSYVQEGKITKASSVRLVRDGKVVFEGKIGSLRRFKDDVKDVAQGYECGIGLENFNDIKEGDIIEAFIQEKIKREL